MHAMRSIFAAAALSAALPALGADVALEPFTTDGCSLFPDRLPGTAPYCSCCVEHDFAYWRGGTEAERLAADRALRQCVARATANRVLARSMYAGVRAGGSPYLHTWFRWGYGWPYGRFYQPLSAEERARADALEREYRAAHAEGSCP
jgi:hypothetical protein